LQSEPGSAPTLGRKGGWWEGDVHRGAPAGPPVFCAPFPFSPPTNLLALPSCLSRAPATVPVRDRLPRTMAPPVHSRVRPFLLFGAHVTWPRRGLATLACACRVQLVGAQARTDAPSTALKQGKTTEDAADAARSLWPGNDPCDTLRAGPMRVEGPLVVLGSIYLVWRRSPSYVERGGRYARQRSVWTGKSRPPELTSR